MIYRRSWVIFDWVVLIVIYSLNLLIIPISNRLIVWWGPTTVDSVFNQLVTLLILSLFIVVLVYILVLSHKEFPPSSFIWLVVILAVGMFVLTRVQITRDRLHLLNFGLLGIIAYRALRHHIGTKLLYLWAMLLVMAFAVVDELIQLTGWGGRNFELRDILIDWFAAGAGLLLIAIVIRPKLESASISISHKMKDLRDTEKYLKRRKERGS